MQVAAHEARKGNSDFAHDIRNLIDIERKKSSKKKNLTFQSELNGLVNIEESEISKQMLVLSEEINERIGLIIHEFRQQAKLKSYGLTHRRKILLIGPPGTGKTMTAKVLAYELKLPLYTIQGDRLVTKFMGETSAKLRQIFDFLQVNLGVFLFDEFDAIGGKRTMENDVGEMRRVLNSFLNFIEQDTSDSIVIAATNNPQLLDQALFRRFDDVLYYKRPTDTEKKELISNKLGKFKSAGFSWTSVLKNSSGLSHSELVIACHDAIKNAILNDKKKISASKLNIMITKRQNALKRTCEIL
ncbi:MAG: ATP-binding protein [Rhodobacteraceae bacterium]|nr:ATP-binding protein [Paracoccaceae bacterium]